MKLSEWYAQDPRRVPFHRDLYPDRKEHLWFGTEWTEDGDLHLSRWTVQWAPTTGELYAFTTERDVTVVGHLQGADEYQAVWASVGQLQRAYGSLTLLRDILDRVPGGWTAEPEHLPPHGVLVPDERLPKAGPVDAGDLPDPATVPPPGDDTFPVGGGLDEAGLEDSFGGPGPGGGLEL